ncbi:hypothetical protein LAZ67_23001450 [Cordylochernes scorpioides]|uniref:Uncharacterized protein n=1 Tax=Cordylochernes scorpioides TaxID=51811 RepID=A0ABY6LQU6_9ARAC|nr:hypothetical protein LAZ67_23001450 [Cordylochernes scorpioides]
MAMCWPLRLLEKKIPYHNRGHLNGFHDIRKAGRTSVKDDLHTERPLSIRNRENALKIKSSIKENPRITIREISEDLDISFGTCQTIIKNDMHLNDPRLNLPHIS